ncbi:DUF5928 domain-containing protein [Pontivivens insulae]|uniref:Peptide O-xylosyltransferase n=1 Tax=Pontivivens insulae TaxID=1639689 RepID=A0A2R8A866_9RHOB|nr:DUF5928 domain-containing protein [Pontivivens insulae]RED18525.1 core-2/I-Branching enzyme [Pontivivens insulae]SPF28423.1 hypothetical protein POI8812_00722 [Pontivivens insulae]
MVRIAYILLCHANPDGVIEQARALTGQGDYVSLHIDLNAADGMHAKVRDALAGEERVVFAKRVKCGWGEWSLVRATLNGIEAARTAFEDATHFYFISGDCLPIKSRRQIADYLATHDMDFVENHDFFKSNWIKTGLKEDRLIYRHFFNERRNKPLFYGMLKIQRELKLKRDLPKGLEIRIGSQWCVLRRSTVDKILALLRKRKDIIRFFSTTWIPDETFFQTLVPHLIPREQISGKILTFRAFSDYGLPLVLHSDHKDLLLRQDALFARKISATAPAFRQDLYEHYASGATVTAVSGAFGTLYEYVTSRGRVGARSMPRMWERGGQIGRGQTVMVVVCKKYHLGKRFIAALRNASGPVSLGYVFDEDVGVLPHLGGIESTREKRGRHRRAVMRLLFEYHEADRLVICLDPSNIDVLRDLNADRCSLRVLEIQTKVDAEYLMGHAHRVGLADRMVRVENAGDLVATLARQFVDESEALRDLDLLHFYSIGPEDGPAQISEQIARFADLPQSDADDIAQNVNLTD